MSAYSNKVRKSLMRSYGHLYKLHRFEGDSKCFYCGEDKTQRDHVPPLSFLDYVSTKQLRELEIPMVLISCCGDCNRKLGSKRLLTVAERLSFLYGRLNSEYEKVHALWCEDEMKEMSPMFRKMIRTQSEINKSLLVRIKNIELRMLDTDSHPIYEANRTED